jgi:branched-chain amino acid aminotransferase
MKVFIDDRIVGEAEARISVLDHGLLYGDGVFEGVRVYSGVIFRLNAHLERILLSARSIGIEVSGGLPRLREIVERTVQASGLDDAYVRLLITRGDGPLGVDPTECGPPRVICIVDEIAIYPAEKTRRGLDLITASVRRAYPDVLDPRVKSLNYLTSVQAKREARMRGADEALLLNREGTVAEATVANVFAYRGGELVTPSPMDGALEGVTRAAVLELAQGLGIPTRERRVGRLDLLGAEEAFLTGTGVEIVPIRSLDGQEIGSQRPGPVTSKLMAAFRDLVRAAGDA